MIDHKNSSYSYGDLAPLQTISVNATPNPVVEGGASFFIVLANILNMRKFRDSLILVYNGIISKEFVISRGDRL